VKTPAQIRQHLREVEAEMVKANKSGMLTEALIRTYIAASDDVDRLNLNEAAYVAPERRTA